MQNSEVSNLVRLYWEFDHFLFDWLEEQEDNKFTFTWYIILDTLARKGPIPLKEITKQLLITPASTSVLIKKMEASGLVTRTSDPTDGRVSLINIASDGEEKLNGYYELMETFFSKYIQGNELKNYQRTLENALKRLKETEN